jgi:Zn-dependent peptidase ImmA (M78 family)
MDAIEHIRNIIDTHDLNKAQIAKEIGMSKERFHYFLNYAKTCDVTTYAKIRRVIEAKGVRVDDLDTLSIPAMAAHINTESSKLIADCIQALTDGILTENEKNILLNSISRMITELNLLREKLQ